MQRAVVLASLTAAAAFGGWGARPTHAEEPTPAPVVVAPATIPTPAILTLRTDPPGASVWEGETPLGTTPLELPLGDATRTLELRAEGYATYTIVQPPSSVSVQHNVALQRERSRPARPRAPDLELREQR